MNTSTSASPTARQIWSRLRGLLLAAAVLAAAGVILAALRSGERHGALDPRSPDAVGSLAVAELLDEHGVTTRVATTTAEATARAGPETTLLVTRPELLGEEQLTSLRAVAEAGGRTVVVGAGPRSVSGIAARVEAESTVPVEATRPRCDLPAAGRAGDADLGGIRYRPADGTNTTCYPREDLPTLVVVPAPSGSGETVLLGTPHPLHNDRLDDRGNASLTLQLLGSRRNLVWYLPSLSDSAAPDGEQGLIDLLPGGWLWGTLQLSVAALLAAGWRARRLGPLVPERLPVIVHAAEATEGRARLYRRTGARDRAAQALRRAGRRRMAPLVGVSAAQADSPERLLPALSHHLGLSHQGGDLHILLFGPAPSDDMALVRLAEDLDTLEHLLGDPPSPAPAAPGTATTSTDKDRTS
ncbi:hypothetical protein N566_26660 [Streptomycetaceae bacterium MP113-05]|nr:hypothetical protein N566_26660 [Streptomycetaceae bacterium MP113-05]